MPNKTAESMGVCVCVYFFHIRETLKVDVQSVTHVGAWNTGVLACLSPGKMNSHVSLVGFL
jgi:hypothetical protein